MVNMTKDIDTSQKASSSTGNTQLYEVRVQAEFLELEIDIDTLLGKLQNLSRLSEVGSTN